MVIHLYKTESEARDAMSSVLNVASYNTEWYHIFLSENPYTKT